jgi:hypothetical protein
MMKLIPIDSVGAGGEKKVSIANFSPHTEILSYFYHCYHTHTGAPFIFARIDIDPRSYFSIFLSSPLRDFLRRSFRFNGAAERDDDKLRGEML